MSEPIITRLELLTDTVSSLVAEVKIKNAHDRELLDQVRRVADALSTLAVFVSTR